MHYGASNYGAAMVFHLWANQSKESGKRGDGRVFFRGPALYSYGNHYVAAYRMPNDVALFNGDRYSVSTTRHVSQAESAASHLTQHTLPNLNLFVNEWESANRGRTFDDGLEPDQWGNTRCYRDKTPAEMAAGRLEMVRRYVAKYPAMNDAAALYLLQLGADKRPAATLAKIRANAARVAALADKRAAAMAESSARRESRAIAAMSDSEFREWLSKRIENTYQCYGRRAGQLAGDLPKSIRHFTKAKDAAGRAGWTHVKSAVWGRLKEMRAAVANMPRLERRRDRIRLNGNLRSNIRFVRQCIATLAAGVPLNGRANGRPESATYRSFANAISSVQSSGRYHGRALRPLYFAAEQLALEHETADRAERERQRIADAAARVERERAARESWFAGGPGRWNGSDANGNAYVRAVGVERDATGAIVAGYLETSHGADVPLPHAIKAWRFVKLCRAAGRGWNSNGRTIRVGHFRVDRIDAAGNMTAGCHKFTFEEMARLAAELGLADAPADESALETA